MPRSTFRRLPAWGAIALALTLGAGACGDRQNARPRETGGEAAPDTAAASPAGEPASAPAAVVDTARPAAPVERPGTASSSREDSARTAAPKTLRTDTAETPATDTAARPSAAASLDSLHPFMPVTITLEVPPAPIRPRVLQSVRAARHGGFERVVFEVAGDTLPGYRIAYAEPPVVACGSGRTVSVAGKAVLLVRLQPAQAHDDAGHATIQERDRKPGFAVLKEMALICDFEGQVQWALGLDRRVPFRILKLDQPARLVLDLEERSP